MRNQSNSPGRTTSIEPETGRRWLILAAAVMVALAVLSGALFVWFVVQDLEGSGWRDWILFVLTRQTSFIAAAATLAVTAVVIDLLLRLRRAIREDIRRSASHLPRRIR
ncbi:MAG: hypothetical protein R3C29_05360 [Dehalococcoidia bacterium]